MGSAQVVAGVRAMAKGEGPYAGQKIEGKNGKLVLALPQCRGQAGKVRCAPDIR
jgi:hypothetical protein